MQNKKIYGIISCNKRRKSTKNPSNAIYIDIDKRAGKKDMGMSKIFGSADIPLQWLEDCIFGDGEVFICQINLSEVCDLDTEHLLPKDGILYFFMDMAEFPYKGVVRYVREGDIVSINLNEGFDLPYDTEKGYRLKFDNGRETDIDGRGYSAKGGIKLLGLPADFQEEGIGDEYINLLQFDPTVDKIDFLEDTDAYFYFCINKDDLKKRDFNNIKLHIESYE